MNQSVDLKTDLNDQYFKDIRRHLRVLVPLSEGVHVRRLPHYNRHGRVVLELTRVHENPAGEESVEPLPRVLAKDLR